MDKEKKYHQIITQCKGILAVEGDLIANLANIAAILYHNLEDVNWAGFYLWKDKELVLGPFQGNVACIRITKGKGVCGTAIEKKETLVIEDVHQFPGHIACDAASESEIVIPIIVEGQIKGVLDIDSPNKSRFDSMDKKYLETLVELLKKKNFN